MIQGLVDNRCIAVEKAFAHTDTKVMARCDENKAVVDSRCEELDQKLLVKMKDQVINADEDWHAELPKNFIQDPKRVQLQNFVQDEVYLQFSHHFNKLTNSEALKRQQKGFAPERKVPLATLKLLELEYKQRAEVEAIKELNKASQPKKRALRDKKHSEALFNPDAESVNLPTITPMSPGRITPISSQVVV